MPEPSPVSADRSRRHDLDALRAFAMLLGIVYHLALSFGEPQGWFLQDSRPHVAFRVFTDACHGFRMQLFFVISGFFTAMLWRRRGLGALVKHRTIRIFIPLIIGLFTVGIANAIAFGWALRPDPTEAPKTSDSLVSAAAAGDLSLIEDQLTSLENIDRIWPNSGGTALSAAVNHGQLAVVDLLLESGADPNARNRDRHVPLHGAAFFGRDEILEKLLEAGADPGLRNDDGKTPRQVIDIDWETTQWIAGLVGTKLDRAELKAGRARAKELLPAPSIEDAPLPDDPTAVASSGSFSTWLRDVWLAGTKSDPHGHLWFLWFLCILLVPFALASPLFRRLRFPRSLAVGLLSLLWLVPVTLPFQLGMRGFGPDTSSAWIPPLHLLGYYAVFFGFGALYYGADDKEGKLSRRWYVLLPLALLVFLPLSLREGSPKLLHALTQTLYSWLMVIGFLGLFRTLLPTASKAIRYLSDSSYWLYIAHLPLVPITQRLVRDWDLNPLVKLLVISTATIGFLLITYAIFVRHTPIGWLLNGRRKRSIDPPTLPPHNPAP